MKLKKNFIVTNAAGKLPHSAKLLKFIIQKSKPMKHAGFSLNRARELSWDFNETV